MRLATYHHPGGLRAAFAHDGLLVDAVAAAQRAGLRSPDAARSVRALIALPAGDLARLDDAAAALAAEGDTASVRARDDVRLAAPVPDARKIVCVGLNYRMHAEEAALDETAVPTLFGKWENALTGDRAPVVLRAPYADAVDFEAELAVVLGRPARDLAEADALDAVAGWMPLNDLSARDLQIQTSQWTAGKAPDDFAPCGPYLVVDDALRRGEGLAVETRVNGELLQQASTAEMLFGIPRLLAFITSFMTLAPGDVVATGTPAGVGMHRTPPRYLRDGDVVEVRVGDEVLTTPIVRAAADDAPAAPLAARA